MFATCFHRNPTKNEFRMFTNFLTNQIVLEILNPTKNEFRMFTKFKWTIEKYLPSNSSGGLYHNVTTLFVYLLGWPFLLMLIALARPKSASFKIPCLVIKTLAAFISRWIILLLEKNKTFSYLWKIIIHFVILNYSGYGRVRLRHSIFIIRFYCRAINSQYFWKWTNANPMKIFGQPASHPML